jgi:hypothetical protein
MHNYYFIISLNILMSQTLQIDTIRCTAIYIWLSSRAMCHLKKDKLLKADLIFDWGFEIH